MKIVLAGGSDPLTNKADGSFDSPFFVRAARGTGLRLKVVVSRELEQLRVALLHRSG